MSDDGGPDRPSPEPVAETDPGPITRFRTSDNAAVVFVRETLSSAAIVAVIGATLFLIAGVWPPMVAVESGSMEPNMQKGDLIFVTEPGRFPAPFADENGIVTNQAGQGEGHVQFGQSGSVIVYRTPNRIGPPIIHRARFHVEQGENWIDRADPSALPATNCDAVPNCPAPHDGYITKGDDNQMYDQVNSIRAPPVREQWITGVARVRIPLLGWIRLIFSGAATTGGFGAESLLWTLDSGTLAPADTAAVASADAAAAASADTAASIDRSPAVGDSSIASPTTAADTQLQAA